MPAPNAQLDTKAILAELHELYAASPFYIQRDLKYAVFAKKAKQIQDNNAGAGLALRAQLDALVGDIDGLESTYRQLRTAAHSEIDTYNVAVAFARLGLFSRTQEILAQIAKVESGNFSRRWTQVCAAGMFAFLAAQIDKAKVMKLDFIGDAPTQMGKLASDILREDGVTDQTVARFLDAAGVVLQRRRRFNMMQGFLATQTPEGDAFVTMQICVADADPASLFDMNMELATVVEEMGLTQLPSLVVTISDMPEKRDELLS